MAGVILRGECCSPRAIRPFLPRVTLWKDVELGRIFSKRVIRLSRLLESHIPDR